MAHGFRKSQSMTVREIIATGPSVIDGDLQSW